MMKPGQIKHGAGKDAEDWGHYFCTVDEQFTSVLVDLRHATAGRDPLLSQLLRVRLHLLYPTDSGLIDESEVDALLASEERVGLALVPHQAVLVGSATAAGYRDLYYYHSPSSDGRSAPCGAIEQSKGHRIESATDSDPDWSVYRDFLHPDDWQRQCMLNLRVISNLLEHGDTLETPRSIKHEIRCATPTTRERLTELAMEMGFRHVEDISEDGEWPFATVLAQKHAATPERVDTHVRLLFDLAKDIGAEYDGWETEVMRAPTPTKAWWKPW